MQATFSLPTPCAEVAMSIGWAPSGLTAPRRERVAARGEEEKASKLAEKRGGVNLDSRQEHDLVLSRQQRDEHGEVF
jgi:hypothetical protein